jgi:large subunit ribosomal protein L15
MKLNQLKPAAGATKKRKRLGCGIGSGHGKTSTHGHKGQKSRSGGGVPPWFEGGQMPLQRRIPKRGFVNFTRKEYQVVNVGDLASFEAGATVGFDELRKAGLVKKSGMPVKLLGNGSIENALTLKVNACSKSATEKIDKCGGKIEILAKG